MNIGYYEPHADINPALLKELLLELSVSPETGTRLGVPEAQLEKWLRELAAHLSDWPCLAGASKHPEEAGWSSSYENGRLLSAGEISFLLHGLDTAHASTI
jgi:hypothetical protein